MGGMRGNVQASAYAARHDGGLRQPVRAYLPLRSAFHRPLVRRVVERVPNTCRIHPQRGRTNHTLCRA